MAEVNRSGISVTKLPRLARFYSSSLAGLFRHAAVHMDKILKGAKPADIAGEQPMKFEMVINLKTAKALGLTTPPNVLVRAQKVIK